MKVFVQIPCLNEEATLPLVLGSIPRTIPGADSVEILVIDDGSTDRTVEVARSLGVEHIVRHSRNQGLARSFRDGIDYALAHGADIVVNTDGDNQYPQERIADLVAPLIAGQADIAIADRQTAKIAHFSRFKKLMQAVGSRVVNRAAGTHLPDAASGFRAYSKESLLRLNVVTQFSYCMETIIQAGNKRLRIASVPVETNPKTRESRLFSNIFQHMAKSGMAIVRSFLMFKPHVPLGWLAFITGVLGTIPFVRFLYYALQGDSGGRIQSLIFGSAMLVASLLCIALLVIADLQRTNRVLIEEALERVKGMQYAEAGGAGVGAGGTGGAGDSGAAVGPVGSVPADVGRPVVPGNAAAYGSGPVSGVAHDAGAAGAGGCARAAGDAGAGANGVGAAAAPGVGAGGAGAAPWAGAASRAGAAPAVATTSDAGVAPLAGDAAGAPAAPAAGASMAPAVGPGAPPATNPSGAPGLGPNASQTSDTNAAYGAVPSVSYTSSPSAAPAAAANASYTGNPSVTPANNPNVPHGANPGASYITNPGASYTTNPGAARAGEARQP